MSRNRLSEAEIEYQVEKMIDQLDANLMTKIVTQEEYDRKVSEIDEWAIQQYQRLNDKPLHKMRDMI